MIENGTADGVAIALDEHVVELAETVGAAVCACDDDHGHVEITRCTGERRERAVTAADHEARVPARDEVGCGEREEHGVGAVDTPAGVHVARHRQLERDVSDDARIRRDDDVVARLPCRDGQVASERGAQRCRGRARIAGKVLEVDQVQRALGSTGRRSDGGSAHRAPYSMRGH